MTPGEQLRSIGFEGSYGFGLQTGVRGAVVGGAVVGRGVVWVGTVVLSSGTSTEPPFVVAVPGALPEVVPRVLVVEVVARFFDFFAFFAAFAAATLRDVDVTFDADESSARVVLGPTLTFSLPLEQALPSMIKAIAPQSNMPVRERGIFTPRAYAQKPRRATSRLWRFEMVEALDGSVARFRSSYGSWTMSNSCFSPLGYSTYLYDAVRRPQFMPIAGP